MKISRSHCFPLWLVALLLLPVVLSGSSSRRQQGGRLVGSFRTTKHRQQQQQHPLFSIPRGGAAASASARTANRVSASSPSSTAASSRRQSSTGGAVTKKEFPALGTATIPSEVFNLIKSIVGAGVLGLPAGIAAFGDAPSALLPAITLLCCIGGLSAYGFSMIGNVCAQTNSISYRQAWSKSVGERTSWMPAAACLLVTFCTVLTYSMILADTIPAILQAVMNINVSRTTALLSVTSFALLPLCLLKSLSSLAPFSLLGILGMVYTSTVMAIRYMTNSYAPNSPLTMHVPTHLVPHFGDKGWRAAFSTKIAILISMLSTAFMSHYNAPIFYWELKDATMPRYNRVVSLSFMGAILLMAVTAAAGFATFGSASDSLILNNYAVTDTLMSVSRFAVALSLLFSYPLAFVGVREGFLDLMGEKIGVTTMEKRQAISDPLSIALLALITGMAFVVKDIRIILALGGATWGNCVIYLFPSLMMIKTILSSSSSSSSLSKRSSSSSSGVQTRRDHSSSTSSKSIPSAIILPAATGLVGLCLGVVGTVKALQTLV